MQETALILHNVVISDHVMGDVNMRYNPANGVEDFGNFQMATLAQTAPEVEVVVEHTTPQSVYDVVAIAGRWESLANEAEHRRLCSALMQKINNEVMFLIINNIENVVHHTII